MEITYTLRATLTLATGYICQLAAGDILSYTLDEGAQGGDMLVGAAPAAHGRLTLANPAGAWLPGGARLGTRSLFGATAQVEIAALGSTSYAPAGCFIVSDVQASEGEGSITLSGYDGMLHALNRPFADTLVYPQPLSAILSHIIAQSGRTLSGAPACNASVTIAQMPDWGSGCTLRRALGWAAGAMGCFARFDRAGQLTLCPVWQHTTAAALSAGDALSLSISPTPFLLNRVRIVPRGSAEDISPVEAALDDTLAAAADNTLEISDNALFRPDAPELVTLAEGLLQALSGMSLTPFDGDFVRDPALQIGQRVTVGDLQGTAHGSMIYSLRLSLDGELTMSLSCGPDTAGVTLPTVLSGSGLLAGGALGEGIVTMRNLAAGSVTADKIAAGAIDADAVRAVTAEIHRLTAGQITSDRLYADLAAIAVAQLTTANIDTANINWANVRSLAAQIAQVADAHIGTAFIDYTKIVDSVTDTAIITQGEAGQLYISRLAVNEANMVSLSVGEVLLRTASGGFARLTADQNGAVSAEPVAVTGGNLANATIAGGKLIENTITARELNVDNIFADAALIRAVKAANIDVADLFAASGTITELDNYLLRASTIQAIQGTLDLWASNKITLAVNGLKVGGRNLLRGTSNQWQELSYNGEYYFTFPTPYVLEPGETYTFSILVDKVSEDEHPINLTLGCGPQGYYMRDIAGWRRYNIPFGQRVSLTYTVQESDLTETYRHFAFRLRAEQQTTTIRYKEIKLEHGNLASDWTPAPEDASARYEQYDASISVLQNGISAKADKTVTDSLGNTVATLQTAIAAVPGQITQAVKGVSVGGRNLIESSAAFLPSAAPYGNSTALFYDSALLDGEKPYFCSGPLYAQVDFPALQSGLEYTFSLDLARSASAQDVFITIAGNDPVNVGRAQVRQWGRFSLTFTANQNTAYARVQVYNPSASASNAYVCFLRRFKLERGNVATDWDYAPEDTYALISAAQQTANQNAAAMAQLALDVNDDLQDLRDQIDGNITSWFYDVPPTLGNAPAANWTTDEQKNTHLGDLYYDTMTGYCYRWQVQNGVYGWQRLTDTAVTKALADAAQAQDTADSKRRVFYAQPAPPYDAGDLWVQGEGGDILRCATAKADSQAYAAADWVAACKYTDNAAVNALEQTVRRDYSTTTQTNQLIATNVSSVKEWTDQNYASKQLVSSNYSTVQQTASQISAAVTAIDIGTRNLLLKSEPAAENSLYTLKTYEISDPDAIVAGDTYSISFEGMLSDSSQTGFYINVYPSPYAWCATLPAAATDGQYHRYAATFFMPQNGGAHERIGVYAQPMGGGKLAGVRRVKLERGNKATDWTPAPEEPATLVKNSAVTIDANGIELSVSGGGTVRAVIDGDEKMRVDAEGVKGPLGVFDEMRAPNVVSKNLSRTIPWKGSIQASIDACPRYIQMDATLSIPAGTYYENVVIQGFIGAQITLDGSNGVTLVGSLAVIDCTRVCVRANALRQFILFPPSAAGNALYVHNTSYIRLENLNVSGYRGRTSAGNGTTVGMRIECSKAYITGCCIEYTLYAVHFEMGSSGYCVNNSGGSASGAATGNANIYYGIHASTGSSVAVYGTTPYGCAQHTGHYIATLNSYETSGATGGITSGDASPSQYTRTFAISRHCTYEINRQRLRDDQTGVLYQGKYGAYSGSSNWRVGAMWFGAAASALSGKTVVSAQLRLRRSGGGWSNAVPIYLCAVNLAEGSYTTTLSPSYTTPSSAGSLRREAEATFDVTSLMSAVKNGYAIGVCEPNHSYAGDWSPAYTQIYGKGSAYAPELTVTYR